MSLEKIDEFAMAKLAREMAMNIRDYAVIFEDFGITEEDFYEISKNDFFKRAKEQFAIEWNSAASAAERVRLIHAAYAEELAPTISHAVMDENKSLSDRLEGYKIFCKGGGIGEPKAGPGNNERFVISINIGGETKKFDKSIDINPEQIDGQVESSNTKSNAIKLVRTPREGDGA
jgi:hypothetical protein